MSVMNGRIGCVVRREFLTPSTSEMASVFTHIFRTFTFNCVNDTYSSPFPAHRNTTCEVIKQQKLTYIVHLALGGDQP